MEENIQQNETPIIPVEIIPAKKPFPKKTLAAIISAVVVVLCIATAIIINANMPINRFNHALKAGEYDVASAIYEQNSSDEKFVAKTIEKVSSLLSSSLRKYADGGMPYEEMNALLNNTSDYKGVENRSEIVSQVKQIRASKESYEQAEANVENKAYLTALGNYAKVIEEDTENYSSAQKAIASTTELLCSDAIEQATSFMNQEDAVNAYEALSAVGDYKNDAVAQMLTEVTEKAQGQIIGQAQTLCDSGDYRSAYLLLSEQPDSLKNDKIKAIESSALENLLAQADAEAVSGNYDGAIALLTAKNGNGLNSDCDAKIKEIKHTANVSKLGTWKNKVNASYDKIDNDYSITLRGDTRISRSRNIFATVAVFPDSAILDYATFYLALGFLNKDWIFMDEIIIDCDGKQFNLEVSYKNRQTDVGWGTIAEMTAFADVPQFMRDNDVFIDAKPIVEAMRTANTVTVRFRGDDGKKDVTIPKSHIEQVVMMWDISKILEEDASLVGALM